MVFNIIPMCDDCLSDMCSRCVTDDVTGELTNQLIGLEDIVTVTRTSKREGLIRSRMIGEYTIRSRIIIGVSSYDVT